MGKIKDIVGKRFGKLIALENTIKNSLGGYKCECKCDCGNTKFINKSTLLNGKVNSCGCLKKDRGRKNRLGTKDIPWGCWRSIKSAAKSRNLEITIDINYIQELLENQNFICALSGIKLIMCADNIYGEMRKLNTASLDRIDSTKGYVPGNVQWIHKLINEMKWNYTQNDFVNLCKKITEYRKNKK